MKSTMMRLMLVMAFGSIVLVSALAGDLEPPGPPGPTMVTLQQIYDKLDACTGGGPCGVPTTGQASCWNASGTPIGCAGTGQDGEYQAGVAVAPRFTDNLDGTVTDNLTGLTWLQNADCFGFRDWTDALTVSNSLASGACGLTDGSMAGDWRLPNLKELQSLIDFGQYNPALPPGHPFVGVQLGGYWSSTTGASAPNGAWLAILGGGVVNAFGKASLSYVWPVKGGL